MKLTANALFITGGASGIRHGLAEARHKHGDPLIIGGRRRCHLNEVICQQLGGARSLQMNTVASTGVMSSGNGAPAHAA